MTSLSDFQIDQQVCELRAPQSFLFWDYAGRLWTSVGKAIPDIKVISATPANTQFEAGDLLLVAEPGILRSTARGSVSMDDFISATTTFFEIGIDLLKFQVFDRVGYRVIFSRDFSSMSDAAAAFGEWKVINTPADTVFGVKQAPTILDSKITWESEDLGILFGLRTEKRTVEARVPWEMRSQVQAKGSERFLLVVDVDRYTKKQLNREQLGISEYIGGSNRAIRKSLTKGFLE